MPWLEQHLPDLLLWLTALTIVTLVAAVVAIPWVVARLPADYFHHSRREPLPRRGLSGLLLSTVKNLAGLLLVLLGLVLLFTPGQGLLTILLGMLLMNFPGKYRIERAVARRKGVFGALNWIRERRGLPAFLPPDSPD